jgi:carbon monoxide dehydrogenase subunit G
MRFSEEAVLDVPVARAWGLLTDPVVLAEAIPGCDRLEVTGPDTGRFTISMALAAISGTYAGRFEITSRPSFGSVTLTARATGDRGEFLLDFTLRLTASGADATVVGYDVDGRFSGGIAGAGQRLLAGITRRLAADFFSAIAAQPSAEPGRKFSPPVHLLAAEPDSDEVTGPAGRTGVRAAFAFGVLIGLAGVVVAATLRRRSGQRPGSRR